ncbi:MAG: hypothetical protein OEY23_19390 [Acidimicrobiia bacterium]|nr:hypothetical protein [Acidimicrobiia bacterium]
MNEAGVAVTDRPRRAPLALAVVALAGLALWWATTPLGHGAHYLRDMTDGASGLAEHDRMSQIGCIATRLRSIFEPGSTVALDDSWGSAPVEWPLLVADSAYPDVVVVNLSDEPAAHPGTVRHGDNDALVGLRVADPQDPADEAIGCGGYVLEHR